MLNIPLCFCCVLFFSVAFCNVQKMEKQLESNIPCKQDADCMKFSKDSLCLNNTVDDAGVCVCFKDFIPQKNKTHYECLPTLKLLTDTCEKDVQCQVSFSNWAHCRNKQCACVDGSHFWNNKCYQTIRFGETCSFNQECLLKNNSIATCQAGKCSCGFRQHPFSGPDGESCETSCDLGDECNKDEECFIENTRCFGTCKCRPGYTTNGDGMKCLRQAENLGDYCLEDPQCEIISNNVYCENFSCRCRNRHHVYLNKCYKNVPLNGTCSEDRECWLSLSLNNTIHCKEGICTCVINYTDDGKECVSIGYKLRESYFVIVSGVVLILQLMSML